MRTKNRHFPATKGRALIVGYGNPYCRDDGVALFVINALRKASGVRELSPEEDGLDELGHDPDTVMLHQIVPEMTSVIAPYQTLVFVDAHEGIIPDPVRIITVQEEYGFHAVSHHMSPGMLLGLARKAQGASPEGYLVSIKGEDFDFGLGLSEACLGRVETAVLKIREILRGGEA